MLKFVQLGPHCTGTLLLWPPVYIWWMLKHVRLASGRYASYWNAFLLCFFLPLVLHMHGIHFQCKTKTLFCRFANRSLRKIK